MLELAIENGPVCGMAAVAVANPRTVPDSVVGSAKDAATCLENPATHGEPPALHCTTVDEQIVVVQPIVHELPDVPAVAQAGTLEVSVEEKSVHATKKGRWPEQKVWH